MVEHLKKSYDICCVILVICTAAEGNWDCVSNHGPCGGVEEEDSVEEP